MIRDQFVGLLVVPSSGAIIIILILAIVRIGMIKNTEGSLELDVDFTITDIVAIAVIGDEFGKFKSTAADSIESAYLLRDVLAYVLILVADHVGRFDAEAYCGAVIMYMNN